MPLTKFSVDNGPHNMDGLRLFAQDGSERIEAFIGRKVMDVWAESVEHCGGRQSLFRGQYNALGKLCGPSSTPNCVSDTGILPVVGG
jgi:hypothetical protein